MLRSPSDREQRALALALLGVCLAAAYWLLVHSWFVGPLLEINQRMQTLAEQDRHYSELLVRRDGLQRQLQDARTRSSDTQGLLPGEDASAVAADLMQRVSGQVKGLDAVGGGCSVIQRMPIATERSVAGPWRPVMLSMDLDCAIEPLLHLLYWLEYARPLLFVEELNISRGASVVPQDAQDTPAPSQPTQSAKLTVHLLIAGYMAGSPTEPAAGSQGDTEEAAPDAAVQSPADEGADR